MKKMRDSELAMTVSDLAIQLDKGLEKYCNAVHKELSLYVSKKRATEIITQTLNTFVTRYQKKVVK